MYFTYVVRPGDAPVGRSPQFRPFWDGCMNWNLRFGLLLQLSAFTALNCISIFGSRHGVGFVNLTTNGDRMSSSFAAVTALAASFIWIFGSCMLNGFRNCADDEGSIKYSRGYRSGTKLLSQAGLLDIMQAGLMAFFFYAQFSYLDDSWQTESISPNPMVIYGMMCRFIHVVSLLFYGGAFFLMEAYHPQGTAECWGWTVGILYKSAAFLEFTAVVFRCRIADIAFTAVCTMALVSSFIWAQAFEDLVVADEVKLDQSALRIEYFKSRNSMAYYGPHIENGVEFQQR